MRAKRIVESLLRFSRRPRRRRRARSTSRRRWRTPSSCSSRASRTGVSRWCAPSSGRRARERQPAPAIVVNLVVNALQAMGASGRLTISIGPAGPGLVRLAVADTGPGVKPEIAKRIFEPFFTTKGGGAGDRARPLHLLPDRRGARRHHPRRALAGGACFAVELLPRRPGPSEGRTHERIQRCEAHPRPRGGRRAHPAAGHRVAPGQKGHEVVALDSPIAATQRLAKEDFDVALLDIKMPDLPVSSCSPR